MVDHQNRIETKLFEMLMNTRHYLDQTEKLWRDTL